MYQFGSRLIKKYFPDFREPNDIDWVTNDISEIRNNLEELFRNKKEYYFIPCTPNREMTPDEIYTLKVSHAIYDIKWEKTMSDIRFLQIKGCKIITSFLRELRKYWISVHVFNRKVKILNLFKLYMKNV